MNNISMKQLPDGRWIPAQPLLFMEDSRPWYIRIWHSVLVLLGYNEDKLIEPYYIPLESPIERDLNKVRG